MSSRLPIVEKLDQDVPGAIVIGVVGMVDLIVLSSVLLHMFLAIVVQSYARRMVSDKERNFITSPCGLFIVCLLISNFITALGGVLEVGWVGSQEIVQGPTCTTQAFLFQLGGNASALWLGVISVSALSTFLFRARSLRTWAALLAIGILWTFLVVFNIVVSAVFAANSKQFFFGIAGLWCWITPTHRMARLFTQYFWMWLFSLLSAACFALVYLSVRGNLVVRKSERGQQIRWNKSLSGSWLGKSEEYDGLAGAVGKTMCWFPICYITLTIPISVSRVAETFGFPVPFYALVFAAVNSLLVGIVNTVIYFAIRHSLKRGSGFNDSEDTLRGSANSDKTGTESFEIPQEKRPSPVGKPQSYPWTSTPVTNEWAQPVPNQGFSPPAAAYREDTTTRTLPYSNASPSRVPVSNKIAQRSRSFHRPMESISSATPEHTARSTPVENGPDKEPVRPQLTQPPPVFLTQKSNPSANIVPPSEMDKLTSTSQGNKRPEIDAGKYTGPRRISQDLNALLEEQKPTSAHLSGPPPPPRKNKRALTHSVPVDVDESDIGSVVSAKSSVGEFDRNETRPPSVGDVSTRTPNKRVDSAWTTQGQSSPRTPDVPANGPSKPRDTMQTFWAAYDDPSPKTSDMPMPDNLRRDTMRSFWAAYEQPSPRTPDMPWPADAMSIRSEAAKSWKSTNRSSEDYRANNPAVFLRPSISAVALAQKDTPPVPPSKDSASVKPEAIAKLTAALRTNPSHRRSTSLTRAPGAAPQSSNADLLRPAASAITRYGSPGLTIRDGPSRHKPTQSESSLISDVSYRPPRHQPGYV